MVSGIVTPDQEARITIRVLGPQGLTEDVHAVIDTGFTGFLTLPGSTVQRLALSFQGPRIATLADGSAVALDVYSAAVSWNGRSRHILVLESEGGPLLGMSLLHGHKLTIEVLDGGPVTIERLP